MPAELESPSATESIRQVDIIVLDSANNVLGLTGVLSNELAHTLAVCCQTKEAGVTLSNSNRLKPGQLVYTVNDQFLSGCTSMLLARLGSSEVAEFRRNLSPSHNYVCVVSC